MNPLKIPSTITDMIRADHMRVLTSFHQYSNAKDIKAKQALADSICSALEIHAQIEEEIFYPILNNQIYHETVLNKSVFEHNELRRLILKLKELPSDASDVEFDDILLQLMRNTLHHIADEETFILPDAEKMFDNEKLCQLGMEMRQLKDKLTPPHEAAEEAILELEKNPLTWIVCLLFLCTGIYAIRQFRRR